MNTFFLNDNKLVCMTYVVKFVVSLASLSELVILKGKNNGFQIKKYII